MHEKLSHLLYSRDAFSREDETDDAVFYARDRFVSHLDSQALATVGRVIGTLVVEREPVILDLMAGWDSHIPSHVRSGQVVGLGLNRNELAENAALTSHVLHDLNRNPSLPFSSNMFDVVLNTVSVDYMTRPFDVFREVGRILKPGGQFLVIFSNRMFPQKAVKIWKESGEAERILLVEDYFRSAEAFGQPRHFISKGRPRPADDRYAHLGIPSDPVYAVYADKREGAAPRRERPTVAMEDAEATDRRTVEERKRQVKNTLRCPHCDQRMEKWAVPDTPFTEWDNDFLYICFNDTCPYLLRGWEAMADQGNVGFSYRLMYDPKRDAFHPVPVPTLGALREHIVKG